MKFVLSEDSAARRESAGAVEKLSEAIEELGNAQVIERVAYIWFNRFCALRFMDVNRYTRISVVSPAEGQFQPEILAEAKMGHIDEEMVGDKARRQIFDLLDGKAPSRDPQGEAYRLLVVAVCNHWHRSMPFLFERINDYTELLMPEDLLSGNSILSYTREAMTPDACQDVEVIGWLYQFYISEKKDEVFDGLKKNKKITPENIPAATQLFTPDWIVRYLVENTLGRLWMLNRPSSKLIERMEYYIKPEQPETDFFRISTPEEIRICDPACGSGHMLVYAFDLLYAIYEEEGYESSEIPEKILTHNLYGIEIDERAGELAAFALTMKARAKQRRFLRKPIQPNICVLENIKFNRSDLKHYMDFIGYDLFTAPLQTLLHQFEEADNFGSLIRPEVTDVQGMLQTLESKDVSGQLFFHETHQDVLRILRQTDYLIPKYHVVISNPPYMGRGNMNKRLKTWIQNQFPMSKNDLMTCFMERVLALMIPNALMGMINIPSWMFLSSFEDLRHYILENTLINSLIHLGRGIFGSDFGTVAFCIQSQKPSNSCCGVYRRLFEAHVQVRNPKEIERLFLDHSYNVFIAMQSDFLRLPSVPFAYWISKKTRDAFERGRPLSTFASIGKGLDTGDNERFLKFWHEIDSSSTRWVPCQKGGTYRKWYGNNEFVIDWGDNGEALRSFEKANMRNSRFYFREGGTWTRVSSGSTAFRYFSEGQIFESTGPCFFTDSEKLPILISYLNSRVALDFLKVLAPMLDFQSGHISNLPFLQELFEKKKLTQISSNAIALTKSDWDAYETSWDFTSLPLLQFAYRQPTLESTYQKIRVYWHERVQDIQRLEEENNRIFIEAFGLQDELEPYVPGSDITLTCNPHYRYGDERNDEELEALLLADTMRDFISYAIGCMFGRYALDRPGLILANQGETIEDYNRQIPEKKFPADNDNVIPILDGNWFTDDIVERFCRFLRITFDEEYYEENLKFVERALGKNGKPRDIRDYFLKDFYGDHVKRYRKRPIYWLFSSPKGSFNALIYMHRYRPDTVSVVLNDYLREFRTKLASHKEHLESISISASATQGEKTKALKEIEKIKKMIAEVDEYEREVLYPLATEQIEIDLDDGVKVNYPKFGAALKKIPGLAAKGD